MDSVENKELFLLRMQKKIVLIYIISGYHSGHGVLISRHGYILTASHLFESDYESGSRVDVDCNGVRYIAKVVKIERKSDLALLQIVKDVKNGRRKLRFEYARIGKRVRIGQPLHMILSPDQNNFTYTSGLVCFERRLHSDIVDGEEISYFSNESYFVQGHGLHGIPGCSGAPVFDSRGRIIGIYSAGYGRMDLLVHLRLLNKMCKRFFWKLARRRAMMMVMMRHYKNSKGLKQGKQKRKEGQ